jgi:hypothetical protein
MTAARQLARRAAAGGPGRARRVGSARPNRVHRAAAQPDARAGAPGNNLTGALDAWLVPGGFNTLQRLSVADNPSLGCDPSRLQPRPQPTLASTPAAQRGGQPQPGVRVVARCKRARMLKYRREELNQRALGAQLRAHSRSAAPSLALVTSVAPAVTLGAASGLAVSRCLLRRRCYRVQL